MLRSVVMPSHPAHLDDVESLGELLGGYLRQTLIQSLFTISRMTLFP